MLILPSVKGRVPSLMKSGEKRDTHKVCLLCYGRAPVEVWCRVSPFADATIGTPTYWEAEQRTIIAKDWTHSQEKAATLCWIAACI